VRGSITRFVTKESSNNVVMPELSGFICSQALSGHLSGSCKILNDTSLECSGRVLLDLYNQILY